MSTIFPGVFNDNGYTANDFCQLEEYPQRSYFHLLGGHKRNRDITESLEEVLFINYPESYRAVTALFPYLHPRSFGEGTVCIPLMTADEPIKSYIEFLNEAERSWSVLSMKDLTEVESKRIEGRYLSRHDDKMSEELAVRINPYLKCFDVPTTWDAASLQRMRERLSCKENAPVERIAVIPTLSSMTRKEFVLYELEYQILNRVKGQAMRVSDLLDSLASNSSEMRPLWQTEIRILLNEGLLIPYHNY